MEKSLTFEQLPKAVTLLTKEVSELKQLLLKKAIAPQEKEQPDKLLSIKEASEFLSLSVPTLYSKVSRNELPYMKRSKRLYFSSAELMDYLKAGRKQTTAEIEAEANSYLLRNKKG